VTDYASIAAKHGGSVDTDFSAIAAKYGGKQEQPENLSEKLKPKGIAPLRFVAGAWKQVNPVTLVKGAAHIVAHPIDSASDVIQANAEQAFRAFDAFKEGKLDEASFRAISATIPAIGPLVQDVIDRGKASGDVAGMLGELTGIFGGPKAYAKAPGAIAKVAKSPTTAGMVTAGAGIAAGFDPFGAVATGLGVRQALKARAGAAGVAADAPVVAEVAAEAPKAVSKAVNAQVARAEAAGIPLLPIDVKLTAAESQSAQLAAWKDAGMSNTQIANAMSKVYRSPAEWNMRQVDRIFPPSRSAPSVPRPAEPFQAPVEAPTRTLLVETSPRVVNPPPAELNPAADSRSALAKYYQIDPAKSMDIPDVVGVHPALGLPMNSEGKVLVRNVTEGWSDRTPGSLPEGELVWRNPTNRAFGNPSVFDIAETLQARANAPKPALSLADQMKRAMEERVVDRMKVPKVTPELAAEQRAGLAKAFEIKALKSLREAEAVSATLSNATKARMAHIVKKNPPKIEEAASSDVVHAPPAFPGQRSGATKARYEFQAKRQSKLKAADTAEKIADQIRKAFGVGGKPSEIKKQISEEWGLPMDAASQMVNMVRGEIK
jgi:hypothetical protein